MPPLTSLGRTTIIVSWTATTLALIALALATAGSLYAHRTIGTPDWLNYAACTIGLVIVAQNTFAILVEGKSEHQSQLEDTQINTLAKVRRLQSLASLKCC